MTNAAHTTAEPERRAAARAPGERAAEEATLAEPGVAALRGVDGAPPPDGSLPPDGPSRHAAALADPRLREAGPTQRARLMRQLQRSYGNGYVEQVLARAAAAPVQRRGEAPAEGQGEDRPPTEAEKAAALQAAAAAETLAGTTKAKGDEQTGKTTGEKAAQQATAQAEQGRAAAASSAATATLQSGKDAAKGAPGAAAASKPGKPPVAAAAPAAQAPAADKAPAKPEQDAGFQAVVGSVKKASAQQQAHEPAAKKAQAAQAAAESPAAETMGKAQNAQVGKMAEAEAPPFDAAGFKAKLMERIAQLAPKSADEADSFKESGKVEGVKGAVQGDVSQEQQKSQGPVEQQTKAEPDPSSVPPKPVTPLAEEQPGAPSAVVGADKAAPKPKTGAEVEQPLQAGSKQLDNEMAENDVSEEQLKKSNEPEFQSAADSKKEAQDHAATAPQEFRQAEQAQIQGAQAEAGAVTQAGAQAMHGDRARVLQGVGSKQTQAKSKDEQERAKVGADIRAIYAETKSAVEAKLGGLDAKVTQAFDAGAAAARQTFENYVKSRMDAYKERRYGGWFGWARWLKDKVVSMPPEVNAFYSEGRNLYIKEMGAVIDKVTAIVGATITEAKAEIARGKQRISEYVAKLPANLKGVGKEAASEVQSQFDELEESVKNKENEVVESLAQKYNESLQQVDARIDELKAANQGLVDKAVGAIKGVIETIKKLKDMLLGVLAKAADVIGKIIKDPIGFLGNLVSAVKQGLSQFLGNILTHLKKGLVGWLFGALAEAGIELPQAFDLKGILQLVLQLLGMTYANIRARAVKLVGEPAVARLEQVAEVFKILVTEGPAGLWKFIMDKLGELKEQAMEALRNFIAESVIKAGITWLLSLLNPASAFIKACKMIYDVIIFFIERGSQIMSLVNSILDSVGAIAAGSLGAAAAKVEESLGKAVPVAISFLASLLGLGGIAGKVKEVIGKIQKPINSLIDKVVGGALKMAKKVVGKVKGAFGGKPRSDAEKQKALQAGLAAGVSAMNKLKGKKVTAALIKPVLGAIKLRHRLSLLQPVKGDKYWAVEGNVQRNTKLDSTLPVADPAEVPAGLVKDGVVQIRMQRGVADTKTRDPYIWFTAIVTNVDIEKKRFSWRSANQSKERTGVANFADKDVKWKTGHESQVKLSEDRMAEENKKEEWSDIVIARKVLNYRHHNAETNPAGKQWEHIIENSAGGKHSSGNLALTSSVINNKLGKWFEKPYSTPEAPQGLPGTGGLPLREFLKDKDRGWHVAWKTHAYNQMGLRLVPKQSERGRWVELE